MIEMENNIEILNAICKEIESKNGDCTYVRKAYDYALTNLGSSVNPEGVSLFQHALRVAHIVTFQIGLRDIAIAATLIHGIIVTGNTNKEKIIETFGNEVYEILLGYKKISELKPNKEAFKSDNFRKLLLTLAGDVRVILIKLADRLEKMREVDYRPFEEQKEICHQVKHLYIPIAHRLGIYSIKTELEERLMKYAEHDIYKDIAHKLKETKSDRERYIAEFVKPLEKEIKKMGVPFEIKGRPKSIFSIWKKMKAQNVSFEEVYDKFAIRVILDSKPDRETKDCWKVYSIVTNFFQPNPKRMRDWISAPKNTGYESLHTTVIGPNHRWVEVQIRTTRMDEIAEKGYAAHWMYKEKKTGATDDWLKKIRETIENPEPDSTKTKDQSKLELYSDSIFIFTPKGDLKKLSKGATVLDFAFAVHTKVGGTCTGAIVNEKIVPIKHQLQNGDKVEILTSKTQSPNIDWLNYVNSSKSKQKIKRFLKNEEFKEANAGKEILVRKFNQARVKFTDANLNSIVEFYGFKKPIELYMEIVKENVDLTLIKGFFHNRSKPHTDVQLVSKIQEELEEKAIVREENQLVLDNDTNLKEYKFAKCCSPSYGDEIFGFVTVSDGIKIHSKSCPNAADLLTKYSYRIIDAKWGQEDDTSSNFLCELRVFGTDEMGLINQISSIISKDMRVNIKSMSFSTSDGLAKGKVLVYAKDCKKLDTVIAKIHRIKGVTKVNYSRIS